MPDNLKNIPQINKNGEESELRLLEKQKYANNWAEEAHEKDQAPRRMIKKVFDMGFEASAEFYAKKPEEMGEEEKVAHNLFLKALSMMEGLQEELNLSLKEFIKNIGGFPGLTEFDSKIIDAAFIIYQHSDRDKEFQKEGLKQMYECLKANPENLSLVYFYYLTGRITMGLYGYQFFGTQSDGENLIDLPDNLKQNFINNPPLFCTLLIERKVPENMRVQANTENLYNLWKLAKEKSLGKGSQEEVIPEFLAKYNQKQN
jgi:hypothetical protein